jgi:dihydrodipicolinate synthase/N-acetylneuraminate lyase
MLRNVVFAVVAVLILSAAPTVAETQFATPEEAKALLEKAVAAVKEDKTKAFEMFATGVAASRTRTSMSGAPTRRTAS